jgi:hypothetical protein
MAVANKLGELDELGTLVLIGVGLYVAYMAIQYFTPDPTDTEGNPNSPGDTSQAAYSGFGVLGSLGNIINQALGGLPQSAGNAIAGAMAPSYTP